MIKKLLLACTALALTPALAYAQDAPDTSATAQTAQRADGAPTFAGPRQGSREATLSGTGSNDDGFDSGSLGVTGSLGWYMSENLMWGLRQNLDWSSPRNQSDTLSGSTRVFADYHFGTGPLRPFVGAQFGYIYGGGVDETFTAGPEIGLKYYVNSSTFILAQTEYQFFFDSGSDIDNNFDDGAFFHTIGLGFNF